MFELNKELQKASLEIEKIMKAKNITTGTPQSYFKNDLLNVLKDVILYNNETFKLNVIQWLTEEEANFLAEMSDKNNKEFSKVIKGNYARVPYFHFQDENLLKTLKFKFMLDLEFIIKQLYNVNIEEINSLHLSRYEHSSYNKNDWHRDLDSIVTGVTLLNNNFEGGEIEINSGGVYGDTKVFDYKDFPIGCIHLFRGMELHHGTPLVSGEKKILTVWLRELINDDISPSTRNMLEAVKRYQNIL